MLHLIFLRDGTLVLSRSTFASWRDAQAAFEAFMTSLEFEDADGLAEFLDAEYGQDRAWLSNDDLRSWLASDAVELVVPP